MVKDAVYQGLHGPLSLEAILAHIEAHSELTLHGLAEGAKGGVLIQVLHQATQAVHTLLYEPADEAPLLRLMAVGLLGSS